jgi:hypothetical protein
LDEAQVMANRHEATSVFSHQPDWARDRRHAPRYETHGLPVWASWQEGEQRCCGQGRLRDLSLSGAALAIDQSPPIGTRVLLRLETDPNAPPIEGMVLRVTRTRRQGGPVLVSLRLANPCPYEFFNAAVHRGYRRPTIGRMPVARPIGARPAVANPAPAPAPAPDPDAP